MLLYHASQNKFTVIKRNQATMPNGLSVPEGELQNKIYLTADLGFALAMAAGPKGITSLNDGNISFEFAKGFNPEALIYIYSIESDILLPEMLEYIDDIQFAVDADELIPETITEYKAKEVFNYYRLVDFEPLHLGEQKFC